MSTLPRKPSRYRITVTPVETDGLPCSGRCSIEFDQACEQDWMRLLESNQRSRGLSGDERSALVVAVQLLQGLMHRHRQAQPDMFAKLRPQLDEFIRGLGLDATR
ncbi:DUF3861 family protein [Pseudoxanthomonas dokdonensis]|uniref:DUF3861 domain-containing protein n=1 Tax=Pseudoxanthomonas dokdonensis TaxID=344882 RepID=A0A0R0CE40_9GAMM|nr:DUF3861 family protein [Pseudoxanthomonas dokdonensis]KRG68009.1 hypothetical protein ABB29_14610 [Pseudoxanthomonas dokdonensis]